MNAQLKPITARAIERPTYDNEFLGYADDWFFANSAALIAWWNAGEKDDRDFDSFVRSQHDIELQRRDDNRRSLRMHE